MTRGSVRKAFRADTLGITVAALLTLVVVTVPLDMKSQWIFASVSILGAIVLGRSKSRRGTLVLALLSLVVPSALSVLADHGDARI
jgi:cellulose synthase (UDP-forming)